MLARELLSEAGFESQGNFENKQVFWKALANGATIEIRIPLECLGEEMSLQTIDCTEKPPISADRTNQDYVEPAVSGFKQDCEEMEQEMKSKDAADQTQREEEKKSDEEDANRLFTGAQEPPPELPKAKPVHRFKKRLK